MRSIGVIVSVLCTVSARAEGVAEHVAQGEELAKQGKWTEAIENFKAADKLEPRAKHACLIALAYIRRELWPQAEVFLAVCEQRANASDPVPDWVPLAKQQLAERLAKAKVATVTFTIKPDALASTAAIGVSSFEPDETFAPRAIHLPHGKHLITATIPGRAPAQQTLEITDSAPREVVLDFEARSVAERAPARAGARASKLPWITMAAGGALVLAGAGYHLAVFKGTRDDLAAASDANDVARYDQLASKFDSQRTTTITLYGVGAAVLATGVVLKYTLYKDQPERAPRVGAGATRGGGMVVMEWSR